MHWALMLAQVHEQLPSPKMLDKGQSFDPPIRRPGHNGGGTNLRIQHILLSSRHVLGVTRPSVVSTGTQTVSWYLDQGHWRKARSGVAYTVSEADQLTCFFFRPTNTCPKKDPPFKRSIWERSFKTNCDSSTLPAVMTAWLIYSILVNWMSMEYH